MTNAEKYTYRVIWSEDDQEHVGLCTEFPGLSHLASTKGGALNGIVELVTGLVKQMVKDKEPIPEPLSLRTYKGAIAVRVPPDQHRDLAMEAAEQGVSLNRLISRKLAR
jgi:predicted HicB family RNase H-like nuclease